MACIKLQCTLLPLTLQILEYPIFGVKILVAKTTMILVSVCSDLVVITFISKLSWVFVSVGRRYNLEDTSGCILQQGQVDTASSPDGQELFSVYKSTSLTDAIATEIQRIFSFTLVVHISSSSGEALIHSKKVSL